MDRASPFRLEHRLMDFPPHPFWDFALDVYRRPGVSDACLELQENQQVDVNLLLFVCWIGASGCGRLNANEIDLCIATVRPWHEAVVRPLRAVRRTLKGGLGSAPADLADGLRRQIQAREIDAEHIEQLMLTAAVPRSPGTDVPLSVRVADAGNNALAYLTQLGARVEAQAQASLAVILSASFPQASAADVQGSLKITAA
jgi:uncharacterized protein (TIGR02444 family)